MANEQNIKDYRFGATGKRSGNEAREFGAKGGKASGEARRRKRDARAVMSLVLASKPILTDDFKRGLEKLGLRTNTDYDLQLIAAAAVVQKAMKGDVSAYKAILETMGEDAASIRDKARIEHAKQMLELEQKRVELMERRIALLDPGAETDALKEARELLEGIDSAF